MVIMLLPICADFYAYADDHGIPVESSEPAIIEQAVITETPPEVIVPEAPAPAAPAETVVPAAPPAQVEPVVPVAPPVPVEPQMPVEPTIPVPTNAPDVPETPAPAETPDVPETPAPTETPDVPETPAPTEAPDVPETPAPTEAPDVPEIPAPTETPIPTETPLPTQSPAVPLSLKLHCDTPNVVAGKSPIILRAEIAGAEAGCTILYQASRDGVPLGQITSTDTSLSYVPDSAGTYSFSAYIGLPDGRSAADTVTVTVAAANDPLSAQLYTDSADAVVGSEPIAAKAIISGGCAPVNIAFRLYRGEELVAQADGTDINFSYMPEKEGTYTLSLIAVDALGHSAQHSIQYNVRSAPKPLSIIVNAPSYIHTSRGGTAYVQIEGGLPEYNVNFKLFQSNGSGTYLVNEHSGPERQWGLQPAAVGAYVLLVQVTDSAGTVRTATSEIIVSGPDSAATAGWMEKADAVTLTGNWAEDIVAIAETQLGYRESDVDFILNESGMRKGYSIYGDWYGIRYGDWCAMFVAFCMDRANISRQDYPVDALCENWRQSLIDLNAYEIRDDYAPKPGDLVFFRVSPDEPPRADHIGIVYNNESDVITTIEGNNGNQVGFCWHETDSYAILGYGNTTALMDLAKENETAASETDFLNADATISGSTAAHSNEVLSAEEDEEKPDLSGALPKEEIKGSDSHNEQSGSTVNSFTANETEAVAVKPEKR